ncbi:hypothetical protein ABIE62_002708 [Porphyrobacter sp. MBR-155]|jgi:hypothetical protein|uniref:hypothetical protein n=1 Tax=Porphyrobacter sp. MBR-155 TaxID=3156464 RepID=UPI0033914CB5
MSYPFDQMTSLVSANQKLGQALFEVARVAAQRQAKIASQGLAVFTQAGAAPQVSPFQFPLLSQWPEIVMEVEQNRQASLADVSAAVAEWRDAVGAAFSIEEAQQRARRVFDVWTR